MLVIELNESFNRALGNKRNWIINGPVEWTSVLIDMETEFPDVDKEYIRKQFLACKEVTEELLGVGKYSDITYLDYMTFFGE